MSLPPPYAGDLSPADAWKELADTPSAKLVDVRTQAEWTFVGVPDLSSLGKQVILLSWQVFPSMALNQSFAEQLRAQGVAPEDTILFLCRSGARSAAAAELMTQHGFGKSFNVSGGFEGTLDPSRHRGTMEGWKVSGLPWVQG